MADLEDDPKLLLKGLEEEVYVGTADADIAPLSHKIAADLCGFVTEPDSRNVEYTTAPYRSYRTMLDRLMTQRCRLRRYVQELGDYTLIPGSTLSLVEDDEFVISNPNNPYYRYIRDTYGTTVVTASTHINIGISDPERLIAAYRLLRAEASMYLALTANSPFLRGRPTGAHSTRWQVFPPTPPVTPFFVDHAHFGVKTDPFTNEVDGEHPLKIFHLDAERDPQEVRPVLFDHADPPDGTVLFHRQGAAPGPPYLSLPLGDDPDQLTVVPHDQRAHILVGHQRKGVVNARLRPNFEEHVRFPLKDMTQCRH